MRSPSKSSSVVFNGLVEIYCKLGDTRTAKWVFDQISMKNVGLAENGVRPNWSTFVGVITACSWLGVVDEGFQHFEPMTRDYDIKSYIRAICGYCRSLWKITEDS